MSEADHKRSQETPHVCFDCGHLVSAHSGEYPGWDLRGRSGDELPVKRGDQGCMVEGCDCRRWFEVGEPR